MVVPNNHFPSSTRHFPVVQRQKGSAEAWSDRWYSRVLLALTFSVLIVACDSPSVPSSGESGSSDTKVQTKSFMPARLVGLSSEDPGSLIVEWLPGTDSQGDDADLRYEVHASTERGFEPDSATLQQELEGEVSARLSGFDLGETYQVLIITEDSQGKSGSSNRLHGMTNSLAPTVRSNASFKTIAESDQPVLEDESLSIDGAEPAPETGTILVSGDDEGFLRRVVSSTTENGRHIVQTEAASLDEIFEELEINTSVRLAAPIPEHRTNQSRTISSRSRENNQVQHEWETGLQLIGTPLVSQSRSGNEMIQSRSSETSVENEEVITDTRYARVFSPASLGTDPSEGEILEFPIEAMAREEASGLWPFSSSEVDVVVCSIDFDSMSHPDASIQAHAHQTLPSKQNTFGNEKSVKQYFEWLPAASAIDPEARPHRLKFEIVIAESGKCHSPEENILVEVPVYVMPDAQLAFEDESIMFQSDDGSLKVTNRLNFNIEPNIDIGAKLRLGSVESARMIAEIDNFSLKQNLLINAVAADAFESTLPIIPQRTFIRVAMAGPVPIVIVGRFELYAKLEAEVTGEVNLDQLLALEFPDTRFGMQYANGEWSEVDEFDPEFSFRLQGEAQAEKYLKATLVPDMSLSFYDAASGRMLLEPYLYGRSDVEGQFLYEANRASALLDADYWFNNLEAGGGLDLELSASLDVFSLNLASYGPETFHIIKETPFAKLPELTTISTSLNSEEDLNSRQIHIQLNHTNTTMPTLFGGGSLWALECWAQPRVITQQSGFSLQSANSMSCDDEYILEYSEPGFYEIRSTAAVTNLPIAVRPVTRQFLTLIDPEISVSSNQAEVTWEEETGVTYNIFITSDPNCDVNVYSTCADSQMIPNAISGVSVSGLDTDKTYYLIIERIVGFESFVTTTKAYAIDVPPESPPTVGQCSLSIASTNVKAIDPATGEDYLDIEITGDVSYLKSAFFDDYSRSGQDFLEESGFMRLKVENTNLSGGPYPSDWDWSGVDSLDLRVDRFDNNRRASIALWGQAKESDSSFYQQRAAYQSRNLSESEYATLRDAIISEEPISFIEQYWQTDYKALPFNIYFYPQTPGGWSKYWSSSLSSFSVDVEGCSL